ncbi:MAG: hypothetical protein B6242_01465 [Anaerolineaceae bacterium 4572_78]|nr:MAG: hypothetical protein B6242_01465 [Anaerolineaceae bacterium 4572_78]
MLQFDIKDGKIWIRHDGTEIDTAGGSKLALT